MNEIKNVKYSILHEFVGNTPTENLFLSKILGFYFNGLPFFMSNDSLSEYLGVSTRQVSRIKTKFRSMNIIKGRTNRIKLIVSPNEIQPIITTYNRLQSSIEIPIEPPNKEMKQSNVGIQSRRGGNDDRHPVNAARHIDQEECQEGFIIDKKIDKEINKEIDNLIDKPIAGSQVEDSNLSFENFNLNPSIDSVNKIDFLDSGLQLKSSILSFYYNCIDSTPIDNKSLVLFNKADYYCFLSSFLRICIDNHVQPQQYLDTDINNTIRFIDPFYDKLTSEHLTKMRPTARMAAKDMYENLSECKITLGNFFDVGKK